MDIENHKTTFLYSTRQLVIIAQFHRIFSSVRSQFNFLPKSRVAEMKEEDDASLLLSRIFSHQRRHRTTQHNHTVYTLSSIIFLPNTKQAVIEQIMRTFKDVAQKSLKTKLTRALGGSIANR